MSSYLKNLYQIAALVSLAAFLCSCQRHDEIEVKLIGEVRTRRTFASIQSITDEKERERYIEMQEKSNPTVGEVTGEDSLLIAAFERIGLLKNNEFLKDRFKPQTKQVTTFTDNSKRLFTLTFFNDSLTGNVHFKISSSKSTVDIDTQATSLQDLDYAFLDIIPGGNKELVFLDDYYIMNGYNFDLKVYEIKIR